MKRHLILLVLLMLCQSSFTQDVEGFDRNARKGRLFFYWGWNRAWYTNSDISFNGNAYDFTLHDVVARDRPTDFSLDDYFNPVKMTIPQFNFRIGYFFRENYNISFGIDHMKYIMQNGQTVKISGDIGGSETLYDGQYDNDDIVLSEDFLTFEHTDGLNYINISARRFDRLMEWGKIRFNLTEGIGTGILLPKTNARLLNNERHDDFHLSGFGIDAMLGINISFLDMFFIQTELKGGYINMHDIRTTSDSADRACQKFFYSQFNIVFGGTVQLQRKPKERQ